MNSVDFDKICSQIDVITNEMYSLMVELFPICRSITGNGVRQSHKIIEKQIKLQTFEIPSQTQVFDWVVPKEWNISDAYIKDQNGNKIIDFHKSNLHVLNYSIPINKKLTLDELKPHLYSIPSQPDVIPYRTSYFKEDWGFCLSHKQLLELTDGIYEVFIDSTLHDGSLTYSELYLKGKKTDEILISCYTCHPSLCNDNLSGVVLTTLLAKYLSSIELNYSYRFLFIPETIGSITWLSKNEKKLDKIKYGLVVTCVGDSGRFTYKKTRQGNTELDKIIINMLKNSNSDYTILDFFPFGSDERQFCSPGFNLPVGSLMRTMYTMYPEYHTSADNLEFVKKVNFSDSLLKYLSVIFAIDNSETQKSKNIEHKNQHKSQSEEIYYMSLNPKCEPHLSKYDLYKSIGDGTNDEEKQSILWILNLSDGQNSLSDISEKSNIKFEIIKTAANRLLEKNLIKQI